MRLLLFPFLGTFGRLPIEIRLMIWEYLFSTLRTQSLLLTDNPLSILCTSRYLYNEVSSHLFNNSVQHISLNPEYNEEEWMVIRLESRAVEIEWTLRNRADAERHFQNFPHSKTTMKVHISCPDQTDPGQLVLLWQKLNALVDLLIPTTGPTIELALNGPWRSADPPARWRLHRDIFYEIGGLQESIQFGPRYRPDYDIVILPFLRLRLWMEDPATNVPAMSDDQYETLHRGLMALFDQTGIELRLERLLSMTQDTAVRQIENALIDTNIFLETSLDELPGITANFLRLERYKNWFKDGTSWESLYETQLRDQLSISPAVIMNIDPWLHRSNQRYIVLILLHHAMYAFTSNIRDGLGIYDKSRIYTSWNSELWSDLFPNGVSELSDVKLWLSRFWSDKFQFKKFHAYMDWLGRHRAEELGVEESICSFIHRLSLWGH